MSGGTIPAQIWRAFMAPAVAMDHRAGPVLPYRAPVPRPVERPERQSPLPEDWGDPGEALREIIGIVDDLIGGDKRR